MKAPVRSSRRAALVLLLWPLLAAAGCNYPVLAPSQPTPYAQTPQEPATLPAPGLPVPVSVTPFLPRSTATSTPSPTPSPTPTPTPENAIPQARRTRYHLAASFDYDRHVLTVEQAITYPNLTGIPLLELALIVDSNAVPGIFELSSLTWQTGAPIDEFTLESTLLSIPLPEPLPSGDQISLTINFKLTLPNRPAALGYTFREAILIDWYPFIPPYQPGSGWLVNKPWPFGEYLAYDLADFEVAIQVLSNTEDLTIAAGAPARNNGKIKTYHLEAARSFAWSVSPSYLTLTREENGVVFTAYVFPEHRAAGEAALQASSDALSLYSELFGAYPRPILTIVEADFPDGREYDGLIFLSRAYLAEYDGTQRNFLTLLAVHETSHQWWYGLVGNDQGDEPWLDEALATYSELLFYEHYYPELANWWWFYRVNYFNPQGKINLPIYDFGSFKPYWYAVYMRGALFLRDLRAEMGDTAFFTFLHDYARQNAYQQVTGADFLALLAAHNDADPLPLLNLYFDQPSP